MTCHVQTQDQGCHITNVICNYCEKIMYVDETGRSLEERYKEHEADISLKRKKRLKLFLLEGSLGKRGRYDHFWKGIATNQSTTTTYKRFHG